MGRYEGKRTERRKTAAALVPAAATDLKRGSAGTNPSTARSPLARAQNDAGARSYMRDYLAPSGKAECGCVVRARGALSGLCGSLKAPEESGGARGGSLVVRDGGGRRRWCGATVGEPLEPRRRPLADSETGIDPEGGRQWLPWKSLAP